MRAARERIRDHFDDDPRVRWYDVKVRTVRSGFGALEPDHAAVVIRRNVDKRVDSDNQRFVVAGLCHLESGELWIVSDKREGHRTIAEFDAFVTRLTTLIEIDISRNPG